MKKNNALSDIEIKIRELELEQRVKWEAIKTEFEEIYEKLKPVNLIKSSISDILKSTDLKTEALNATFSFASGYAAKKIIIGKTNNFFSKLTGNLIEVIVSKKIYQNMPGIKNLGGKLIEKIGLSNSKEKHE
jgi:hypothetical protein